MINFLVSKVLSLMKVFGTIYVIYGVCRLIYHYNSNYNKLIVTDVFIVIAGYILYYVGNRIKKYRYEKNIAANRDRHNFNIGKTHNALKELGCNPEKFVYSSTHYAGIDFDNKKIGITYGGFYEEASNLRVFNFKDIVNVTIEKNFESNNDIYLDEYGREEKADNSITWVRRVKIYVNDIDNPVHVVRFNSVQDADYLYGILCSILRER